MSTVRSLVKNYDNFSLDIPELVIGDAGITVLWGPSGSGKTSLFRILTGLEECSEWSWDFQGVSMQKLAAPQRNIGVVFQNFNLFPHLTARQNILFAAKARRLSASESQSRFEHLVRSLNLESVLEQKAALLSGGEAQRVAIARALIGKPRILFLDEPFSALDEANRDEARKLIKRIIQEEKIPAFLISHDRYDLEQLADQVIKIKDGRLISPSV